MFTCYKAAESGFLGAAKLGSQEQTLEPDSWGVQKLGSLSNYKWMMLDKFRKIQVINEPTSYMFLGGLK